MADRISFNPDEIPDSDPFSSLQDLVLPQDYSHHHHPLLSPDTCYEQHYQLIIDHEHQNLPPQEISESELDQMIHGQVNLVNANNPDSVTSDLFELLGGVVRNGPSMKQRENDNDVVVADSDSAGFSTEELIRIAGAKFIQSCSESGDMAADTFDLSEEELRSVELAEFLLSAAEKVGNEQFERASNLLTQCDLQSSPTGDSVQRLVYYFSLALRERIDRRTGKENVPKSPSLQELVMQSGEFFVEFYGKIPFRQISEFAAIQAIVDSVANATRIHIVDFNLKNGEQWTIFMQALISREENQVEHLKVTSIGTTAKDMLEETGQMLVDFAEAMSLSFSFKLIMVDDFADLDEEMFDIDCDETVAVLSEYLFSSLVSSVEKLDHVIKVVEKMKPCVVVVIEVESNNNSPVFVNRFIEVLFYMSAFFDCLEVCMERDNPHRKFAECAVFGEAIKIVVANEGEERGIRNVKLDVWRAYFRRFGMEEAELSFSCVYQAELVANKFPCWKSCTVEVDGKSLIVGWKGTPIHFVTAWNFPTPEEVQENI